MRLIWTSSACETGRLTDSERHTCSQSRDARMKDEVPHDAEAEAERRFDAKCVVRGERCVAALERASAATAHVRRTHTRDPAAASTRAACARVQSTCSSSRAIRRRSSEGSERSNTRASNVHEWLSYLR